jgi:hypothetical protein
MLMEEGGKNKRKIFRINLKEFMSEPFIRLFKHLNLTFPLLNVVSTSQLTIYSIE